MKTVRRAVRDRTRRMSQKELEIRRFHSDLRKLKQACVELNLWLKDIGEAQAKNICVISTSDYELGCFRELCVTDNENYFLNMEEYEKLVEVYPEYKSY